MRQTSLLASLCCSLVLAGCQCGAPSASCTTSADCPESAQAYCSATLLTCVACLDDTNCAVGFVCGADGTCQPGCRSDQDRCPLLQFCRAGAGCVPCTTDHQCGPGQVCSSATNSCVDGCSSTSQPCPLGLVCDVSLGHCVACLGNGDCRSPQAPFCSPAAHTCVSCVLGTDCRDPLRPVCDPQTGTCVACTADPDCPLGDVCRNQVCVAGCTATHGCPAGATCNAATGQCVQCLGDGQCSGATPRCDPQTNHCVACLPGASDNCPQGQYCRPDLVCERGCKTGADCPSGVCQADHSCGGCTGDAQCAAGRVCTSGTCVAACSAANPCGAGHECCGGRCLDVRADPANCGRCGTLCTAGAACCGSACQRLDSTANCGACGVTCAAGQGCCGASCTALNSLANCGACGVACGVDQFCDGATCRNVVFPNFCANLSVYAITDGHTLDDGATTVLASTITQNCSARTAVTTGPQTNPAWVDQTTGALLLGGGSTVVTAGGPVPNKPVKWLERTRMATKVYYESNLVDTYYFKRRSDGVALVTRPATFCTPHEDVFLVELVADPASGTLALIAYGLCSGGYGTQTGAWYWANVMLPARNAYPDSWYLYQWTDTNGDSRPDANDTFTRLASGQ